MLRGIAEARSARVHFATTLLAPFFEKTYERRKTERRNFNFGSDGVSPVIKQLSGGSVPGDIFGPQIHKELAESGEAVPLGQSPVFCQMPHRVL
jgi:hypothetical protein